MLQFRVLDSTARLQCWPRIQTLQGPEVCQLTDFNFDGEALTNRYGK
jgi:hypothetical protein